MTNLRNSRHFGHNHGVGTPDRPVTTPELEPLLREVGESITVPIAAREFWNDTGLQVAAGQHYEFQAAGRWVDMWVTSDADGYPTPRWSLGQRLSERLRRVPDAPWFALIGTVRDGNRSQAFLIGAASHVVVPMSGRLACFANDVPGFYWNNRGALRLTIRRRA